MSDSIVGIDWQQKGYYAFVELWVANNDRKPTAIECPARYMEQGSEQRRLYLQGWLKARDEV